MVVVAGTLAGRLVMIQKPRPQPPYAAADVLVLVPDGPEVLIAFQVDVHNAFHARAWPV